MKPEGTCWDARLTDPSGRRSPKPRPLSCTMVMDKGLGPRAFRDLIDLAGECIDFVKLGFGTAAITPPELLREKIELANRSGIHLYPGGTFFEIAWAQGQAESYLESVKQLGMNWVEISEGSLSLGASERARLIAKARDAGLFVLTEIGKKESGSTLSPAEFLESYQRDLDSGASYVIVEGREHGENIGIYDARGQIDRAWVTTVLERADAGRIIWEAPQKHQQVALLEMTDSLANLGNIRPDEALALECLRRGLRSDTWHLFYQHQMPGSG
jgi:phosphosulfolactate synthase